MIRMFCEALQAVHTFFTGGWILWWVKSMNVPELSRLEKLLADKRNPSEQRRSIYVIKDVTQVAMTIAVETGKIQS